MSVLISPKFYNEIVNPYSETKKMCPEIIINPNIPKTVFSDSTKKIFTTFTASPQPTCSPDEAPRFITVFSDSTKKIFTTFTASPQPTCSPDEAPRFIKDNFCQAGEFIQKTFDSVKENIGKASSNITGTGETIIKSVKDNPISYAVAAGFAAYTAGIVIGRISKPNDEAYDEQIIYIKQLKNTN